MGLIDQQGTIVGKGWLVGRARFVTQVAAEHGDLRPDRYIADAVVADTPFDRAAVLPCSSGGAGTATLLDFQASLVYDTTTPLRFHGKPVLTSRAVVDGDDEWNRLADTIDVMTDRG